MSPITELKLSDMSLLEREMNKGLMVAFINRDLLNRANLDVRKSIVFYDDLRTFEYAVAELPDADMLVKLYEQTNIRYWSKGL